MRDSNTKRITKAEIDRLRRLCEDATEGPYTVDETGQEVEVKTDDGTWSLYIDGVTWDCGVRQFDLQCDCHEEVQRVKDTARFFAAARDALPAILEALEDATEMVERLRAGLVLDRDTRLLLFKAHAPDEGDDDE